VLFGVPRAFLEDVPRALKSVTYAFLEDVPHAFGIVFQRTVPNVFRLLTE